VDGPTWVPRGEDCSKGAESASTMGRRKRQATPTLLMNDQGADLQPKGLGKFCLHGSTRLIRAPSRTVIGAHHEYDEACPVMAVCNGD
jgi:hypothetical protein